MDTTIKPKKEKKEKKNTQVFNREVSLLTLYEILRDILQNICVDSVPATATLAPATASATLVPATLVPASLVPASLVPASLVPASLVPVAATLATTEYRVTKAAFKRAEIHHLIAPFIEALKPCYYLSKQHYVDRHINYTNFITLLRQLCNVNSIHYTSVIVYIKSDYEIQYTIDLPDVFSSKFI
jgi:hypothetical protein